MTVRETVNGLTFDPSSLFFESVGVSLEGEPFESESWIHPQPASYAEAEKQAKGMLDYSSLVTVVRIKSQLSEELSVRVSTVWR